MRVTLDAQHATPLRQALTRDCGDQPWTMRVEPLHGTGRVRLALYLPKAAVGDAIQRVTALEPSAQFGHLLEVPNVPTDGWQDLMQPVQRAKANGRDGHSSGRMVEDSLAKLIPPSHVLIGLEVASRRALFDEVAVRVERLDGIPASAVIRGLEEREAMGSTGLGQGVAVPHGQIKGLHRVIVLYVRPVTPISFDSPDGLPVSDVVVLFVPEWANTTHLHLLADVAQCFCDRDFRERLHACRDPQAVCRLFSEYQA
ncbi:PTS sugar transporter subunit IIA [Trinickia fusca]|uniref:PTS sugar transporter subunit IIA n=1 Tax=Trinickia fusca TaxID=2419777 RepID=A0A494XCH6_9BURK|nr:PTS sugar transporter subunit IIA [Trinickia fusca]